MSYLHSSPWRKGLVCCYRWGSFIFCAFVVAGDGSEEECASPQPPRWSVNRLVEAQREQSLSRMLRRWSRVKLIVIDAEYVDVGKKK